MVANLWLCILGDLTTVSVSSGFGVCAVFSIYSSYQLKFRGKSIINYVSNLKSMLLTDDVK